MTALAVAGSIAMVPSAAMASTTKKSSTAPNPTVVALQGQYQSQLQTLIQRQSLEMSRLKAQWDAQIAARHQAAAAEQAPLVAAIAAANANTTDRDRDLSKIAADRTAELAQLASDYSAKAASRQAAVNDLAAQLPAGALPILAFDSDAILAQQQADLAAALAPLDAQESAAVAPVQSSLDAILAVAAPSRAQLVASQTAPLQAIIARYAAQVADRQAQLATTLAPLNAQAAAINAEWSAKVAALKAQQDAEMAAAKKSDQKSLKTAQQEAMKSLNAWYQGQLDPVNQQIADAKSAADADIATINAARDRATGSQTAVNTQQLAQFDARTDRNALPLRKAIADIHRSYREQRADLQAMSAVRTAVALSDSARLSIAAASAIAMVSTQQATASSEVNSAYDAQANAVNRDAAATTAIAVGPLQYQLNESKINETADVAAITKQRDAAVASLTATQDRERLLLQSDFDLLEARASGTITDAGNLTPLDATYNPATDLGSLYNTAKNLGITSTSPTGMGVKVALIDTGVVDVDGLRQSDVTIGPDFSFEDQNPDTRGHDTNGHGTHLAGIIAGRDDQWVAGDHTRTPDRFEGIAPDARLISIKAGTADGATDVTQVIAAINWVIRYNQDNPTDPIKVINLAYGTDSQQDYTKDPLSYAAERAWKAGITVVVAAGNDGWDTGRLSDPAIDPFVIAVGADQGTGKAGVVAEYSSSGSQTRGVDVVAPGRSIVSLRNPGSYSDLFNTAGRAGDRFVRGSGTSEATAVVTGSVALVLQAHPEYTPDEVKAVLKSTATTLNAFSDPTLSGAGALNVGAALGYTKRILSYQGFAPSDGSGSIEAARGTSHITQDDGTPLMGEQDVFGIDWSGSRWTDDSWSGSRWTSSDWTGSRWTGSSWSGSRWTGSRWTGSRWTGSRWTGSTWSGSRWTSSNWSGSRWTGFGAF